MLSGLVDFGIDGVVFDPNPVAGDYLDRSEEKLIVKPEQRSSLSKTLVEAMQRSLDDAQHGASVDPQRRKLLLLGVFFLPYHGLVQASKSKKRPTSVVYAMLSEGVKFPNRDSGDVDLIVQSSIRLREMVKTLKTLVLVEAKQRDEGSSQIMTPKQAREHGGLELLRLELGQEIASSKALWTDALTVAQIAEASGVFFNADEEDVKLGDEDYAALRSWADRCLVSKSWELPKLLDGREMMKKFKVKGSRVGELVEELKLLQMLNPTLTKDQAEDHLRDFSSSL
mmetsp:Transcript_25468/g.45249  ORF Transcript_25468/g.45249 Transcript_25468/m.45249 type:complete len:283 (+) Transcript_25468:2-850(+)